ncbi:MAG: DegT/DnrJ/EryC1/StrS family aminotransferase [Bacteroidales bacterium]|jgi:dTDP-4-amino-4,6-dideoxygalactose transaminase|nr:DegT/DnrJ/EryC1/StrS family aminotransferase [Bacteroidales bacterium]MDX9926781.1 DegT/DnrJ/EryC1/StrS family aminotransferase [Bacteroidales bacterium]HNX83727.1 DegT/DnrJ/EryC1/StrS family aminotransferase [Bacteroidales bacterium]HPS97836.1 DegT/DnrJ/EryC1/StrS family aminotransferase [Bacteroidales bacterium]
MKKIEMVDLRSQYERLKADIDNAITGVISSTAFIKGPDVRLFEEELQRYLGNRHVISCANGTDALQIAMMALGLKPGDEVITTNFTFIATVEVIELLGLKTVLVEPDYGSFNISVEAIRRAITPRTRAIVPVHLFGQCADMEPILDLARQHDIHVIEDVAQATGAEYRFSDGTVKKAGTMGTIGCTSFFPSKNLGCYGDGGALFTDNDELAALIRSITNHGMKVRYYHDTIGVNSRLDTIQAAILRVKLRHLDAFNEARARAAAFYDTQLSGLSGITVPERSAFSSHIFHQYTLRIAGGERNSLRECLENEGIPAMIYYPVPLHMQKAYLHLGYRPDDFPVTTNLSGEVLSLPMHTELDDEQLAYITGCIRSKFN